LINKRPLIEQVLNGLVRELFKPLPGEETLLPQRGQTIKGTFYTPEEVYEQRIQHITRILEDVLITNERKHHNGDIWEYSLSQEAERKALGQRGKPQKENYKFVYEEFFDIVEIGNSHTGLTNKYRLKKEYRNYLYRLSEITYCTYQKDSYRTWKPISSGIDKQVRERFFGTHKDISNTIRVNRDAIDLALISIDNHLLEKNIAYKDRVQPPITSVEYLRNVIIDNKRIEDETKAEEIIRDYHTKLRIVQMFLKKTDSNLYVHYTDITDKTNLGIQSGRLYNKNYPHHILDIQRTQKPIREILLSGLGYIDVDINNCHISILNQFYKMVFGRENQKLSEYCNPQNYKRIREQIVKESDTTYFLVKETIISLAYGGEHLTEKQIRNLSDETLYKKSIAEKFYNIYGSKARQKLLSLFVDSNTLNEYSNAIRSSINELEEENKRQEGRLFGEERTKKGVYKNILGYSSKRTGTNEILSHIFQGIETCSLHSVIDTDYRNIISLHHDGWIIRIEEEMMDAYKSETIRRIMEHTKEKMKEWIEEMGVEVKQNEGFTFSLSHRPIDGGVDLTRLYNDLKRQKHAKTVI
jgi:hypothetical protein